MLLNFFNYKDHEYLLVLDMENEKVLLINHFLDADYGHCIWRLIDWIIWKGKLKKAEEMQGSNTNIDKQTLILDDFLDGLHGSQGNPTSR